MKPHIRWRIAWLVLVFVATAIVASSFEVTTSLEQFWLSGKEERRDAALMQALGGSALARTMIFAVAHDDRQVAGEAADALAREIATHPEVERVRAGPEPGYERAVFELYFPRRFGFVASSAEAVADALSDEALQARAQRLKTELARPTGTIVKRVAQRDPWLLFLDRMRALASLESGQVKVEDGRFWANGHALVFATTKHAPTDLEHVAELGPVVDALEVELEQTHGVTIERSAIHRVALETKTAVEADIRRITTVSSLVLVAALLLVWRSITLTLAMFIPLATGILVAIAGGLLVYGELHGLTLAFGATLIGVCLDYPVHLLVHRVVEGQIARHVVRGMMLGAATTLAGFLGLSLTVLPGIRQIGVFACIGVAVAVATAFAWHRATPTLRGDAERLRRQAAVVTRVLERARSRTVRSVLLVPALLLALVGVTSVRWVDDVRALADLAPGALREEERAREIVGRVDLGRVIVAWGEDDEEALRHGDWVAAQLEARGIAYRSLHEALWSRALQEANLEAVRAQEDLAERTRAALQREGFRPEAFADLEQELAQTAAPLRPDDLEGTVLESMLDLFRVEVTQPEPAVAMLTYVGELEPDLVAHLQSREGVSVFEQGSFLASLYRRYRTNTLPWLGVGVVLIFVVLVVRYRDLRRSVAAFLPACIAAPAVVGIVTLLGQPLHLLHLVGLLLVLSMSVDYGVFLVECEEPEQAGVAGLGLLIAWLSTILGFGLLALSDVPALSAVGLVVALGVTLGFILAPIAWVQLVQPRRSSSSAQR